MFALVPLLIFVLVLVALVDIIIRADGQVKYLPKVVWVLLVVFLPLIGSALWFAIGREYAPAVDRGPFGDPRRREPRPSGHGLPSGRPKSTEEQLAELEDEIERYETEARISQLEAELKRKRELPE
jgi:hypothetical protein